MAINKPMMNCITKNGSHAGSTAAGVAMQAVV